ncbi:acyl-CoA dehydrogenase [bacterium (Candidatus Blackallbacteria) CG17_big_fil_post_rev_8_21_14_2_50_48_46]|uniref:Acyl-CoA dehydrogenase n=1 Tax=bacterium (Candidatus Blackallbacteria) CG17_big_fil_post_rev_8_21_14_2_50_48_46 TaxID=2014261 RepID=A0A2M7G3J7_9BACT|nr:MAG: acyl-CoA dehydrogenase [bacterium (Candidatus Blackallbacteria) CG18_big_fil_WC_8_21_14_2_50_49_26]PIW16453.1 MAG: acyl-CoA dehydrogenase [bacterium (Candidatus Blackallbacteria) CG17_big_fil_post_rev_8_21_14_2_50_48_46]PIW45961.1 MAG: acyl-CoA dehydrogenase [bacterium (Candidatus Blackallbacteria) CG13_big_fil_rev_8_21_14_2_50_49_14]
MWKLTEEQQMIQKTVREWAQEQLAPVAEKYEHEKTFPVELYKEFAALGFPGIRYPEELGGGGGGILDMCLWVKELAKVLPGFAISASVACGLGAKMLSFGTPEQQKAYLIPTIEGSMIGAFGLTEPNAGSDATNLQTKAVREGDEWVLNGAKTFITNGCIADYILVSARTNMESKLGISIFIVPGNAPGLIASPIDKNCWFSSDTALLTLENLRLPADALLGPLDGGLELLTKNLNEGRITFAAFCHGVAEGCFDGALAYVHQRTAFGKKIADFQNTQFKLAEMKMKLDLSWTYIMRAAAEVQENPQAAMTASICKNWAAQISEEVAREARHLLGGYGCMNEYAVGRLARDVFVSEVGEGSREINWRVIWKALSSGF